ncbi:MAG: hypothetical protein IRZ13_13880 [Acetobacteraceae bacterium]|nr:hypothetical protein [Acetobacteraceae bacterium]
MRFTTDALNAPTRPDCWFDGATGAIRSADLQDPGVDNVLYDLGERALKDGAEVVIVPAEGMPTDMDIAAT